ncbi:MAG: HlyD family efflux transporter periplasmic adaptor subunit [Alphaproteobacteria bacterium]|nr:HlyD family efflux transporter periplasmic adaptor subunit [Alphaproteobacteria bacterium]
MKYQLQFVYVGIAAATLVACGDPSNVNAPLSSHGNNAEAAEDGYTRGPHGGRLLEDGQYGLEVTIFETGVPPQYRIYPFLDGQPLDPSKVDLTIRLHRLGGMTDTFSFTPRQDYLIGDGVVTEPHSFDVEVEARIANATHSWRFESFEGRTRIADTVSIEAGVEVAAAGPATIRDALTLSGEVTLAPSATSEVRATYPGPVRAVSANVGDTVQRGQTIARIESSSSLQEYTVTAPRSGTILERHTNLGDVAGTEALFVIADFSQMEAYLHVFPRDVSRVKTGQDVRLGVAGGELNVDTTISRFLPMAGVNSQTRVAVAKIPAGSGLQPGMRLMAEVTTAETDVPLAVRETGLQSFRDFTVVYAKVDETYEVRMLELGRRDGEYVEVLGGLRSGEVYVTENSFLIKADIDKSAASHDH